METNYKEDVWQKNISSKDNKSSTRILTSKEQKN